MMIKRVAGVVAIAAMGILGALPVAAQPNAISVEAVVTNQQCQGGDFVNVTLSATVTPTQDAQYVWDFNNDGRWDTAPSTSPTVTTRYPDEVSRTAKVGVRNRAGERAMDTVTFATLRCGG